MQAADRMNDLLPPEPTGMTHSSAIEDLDGAIILDAENSERRYYQDPFTALQREIWRPGTYLQSRAAISSMLTHVPLGDGDGDRGADYFDKPGGPPTLDKRWKLYQSQTGSGPIKHGVNEPPKWVILDDRAAYDVGSSNVPRAHLVKYWSHDFGSSNGKIRHRRPHRGRGAVGDPNAEGDDRYHFARVGNRDENYYFTGQPDYKPIVYRTSKAAEPTAPVPTSRPGSLKSLLDPPRDPRKHGHNQYTPKDQLVKYGAPHGGKTHMRYLPRVNAFLKRDPSPERPLGNKRLLGKALAVPPSTNELQAAAIEEEEEEEGLWVEPDDPTARKRQRRAINFQPVDPSEEARDVDKSSSSYPTTTVISLGGSETPEPEAPPLRRTKLPKHADFFSRFLAEQESADKETPDSGSYASRLERALAMMRKTVEEQKRQIEELQRALEEKVSEAESTA